MKSAIQQETSQTALVNTLEGLPQAAQQSSNSNTKSNIVVQSKKANSNKAQKITNATTIRAGDWICNICNNLNFSFRNDCNRCQMQTKKQNYLQNLLLLTENPFFPSPPTSTPPLLSSSVTQTTTDSPTNSTSGLPLTEAQSSSNNFIVPPQQMLKRSPLSDITNKQSSDETNVQNFAKALLPDPSSLGSCKNIKKASPFSEQRTRSGFENMLLLTPPKQNESTRATIYSSNSNNSNNNVFSGTLFNDKHRSILPYQSPLKLPSVSEILKEIHSASNEAEKILAPEIDVITTRRPVDMVSPDISEVIEEGEIVDEDGENVGDNNSQKSSEFCPKDLSQLFTLAELSESENNFGTRKLFHEFEAFKIPQSNNQQDNTYFTNANRLTCFGHTSRSSTEEINKSDNDRLNEFIKGENKPEGEPSIIITDCEKSSVASEGKNSKERQLLNMARNFSVDKLECLNFDIEELSVSEMSSEDHNECVYEEKDKQDNDFLRSVERMIFEEEDHSKKPIESVKKETMPMIAEQKQELDCPSDSRKVPFSTISALLPNPLQLLSQQTTVNSVGNLPNASLPTPASINSTNASLEALNALARSFKVTAPNPNPQVPIPIKTPTTVPIKKEVKNLIGALMPPQYLGKVIRNPGSAGNEEKKGDWICLRCNNLNYSFRQFCNRCQIYK